jgi:uncharacterized protein (TIGR01244 family)
MKRLDPQTFVAGQVLPEEMEALAAAGVARIVNNRPDGEEPGQPPAAAVEAAARAAGLDYRHIPVASGIGEEEVEAMADALADGRAVLAFCKSGTRSAWLWAFARASRGAPAEELVEQAAAAGYDLRPLLRR